MRRLGGCFAAGLAFVAWGCGASSGQGPGPAAEREQPIRRVAVLSLPAPEISPATQDQILVSLASNLHKRYRVDVLTGISFARAVWGGLDPAPQACAQSFADLVRKGRKSVQQLRISRAFELFSQARAHLPFCGAEVRSPSLLKDLFLYTGIAHLSRGEVDQAESAFRQVLSFDSEMTLSMDKFQAEQVVVFDRARGQLLSGNPTRTEVLSWPEGATVFIDARKVGVTPIPAVPLYPGQHFMRIVLEDHAPWTWNFPDAVPPASIKAHLLPIFDENNLDILLAEAGSGRKLSESARERLKRLANFYKVDAVLLAALAKKEREILLGAHLFVAHTKTATKARVFSLGSKASQYERRIKNMVRVFKELRRKKRRSRKSSTKRGKKKGE